MNKDVKEVKEVKDKNKEKIINLFHNIYSPTISTTDSRDNEDSFISCSYNLNEKDSIQAKKVNFTNLNSNIQKNHSFNLLIFNEDFSFSRSSSSSSTLSSKSSPTSSSDSDSLSKSRDNFNKNRLKKKWYQRLKIPFIYQKRRKEVKYRDNYNNPLSIFISKEDNKYTSQFKNILFKKKNARVNNQCNNKNNINNNTPVLSSLGPSSLSISSPLLLLSPSSSSSSSLSSSSTCIIKNEEISTYNNIKDKNKKKTKNKKKFLINLINNNINNNIDRESIIYDEEYSSLFDINVKEPFLEPQREEYVGKKTLVLDLDETLIHSSFQPIRNASFIINIEIDGDYYDVYVLKRPGVDKFLNIVSSLYEVVIFTASLSKYANPLLDQLDPLNKCPYRLFRENCTIDGNSYIKDLSKLGRPLKDIIIIDNSPISYVLQPENAIPISSWFNDENDTQLYDLIPLLEIIARGHPTISTSFGSISDYNSENNNKEQAELMEFSSFSTIYVESSFYDPKEFYE